MTAANLLPPLIWLVMGAIVGALAAAARLDRAILARAGAQRHLVSRWWAKIAIGALSALVGGWLGVLVFGRLFGVATALWVSVVCATLLPWLIQRPWRRAPKTGEATDDSR